MVCFDSHRCRTPNSLEILGTELLYPQDLEHECELDAVEAQNNCGKYQSYYRWGSGKRMFLLIHCLSFCKLGISRGHSDCDKTACLFLHKTVDVGEPKCCAVHLSEHRNNTDQKSIVCSGRDIELHCFLHRSCRTSNALHKHRTLPTDSPGVTRVHEVQCALSS